MLWCFSWVFQIRLNNKYRLTFKFFSPPVQKARDANSRARKELRSLRAALKATRLTTITASLSTPQQGVASRQLTARFITPFFDTYFCSTSFGTLVPWRESGFSWFSWCFPRLCCTVPKRPGAGPATRTASDGQLMASTRPWAASLERTTSEGYTRSVWRMWYYQDNLFFCGSLAAKGGFVVG